MISLTTSLSFLFIMLSQTISRVMSLNGHLSRLTVTSKLQRPTWKQIGPIYRFHLGLARMRFTYALPVTSQAVSSYLAISPLPRMWRYISVALAWGLPLPDVIRHPALWSPDFPHRFPFVWNGATICPTKHQLLYHILHFKATTTDKFS